MNEIMKHTQNFFFFFFFLLPEINFFSWLSEKEIKELMCILHTVCRR